MTIYTTYDKILTVISIAKFHKFTNFKLGCCWIFLCSCQDWEEKCHEAVPKLHVKVPSHKFEYHSDRIREAEVCVVERLKRS